jgi:hypothetical protein
MDLATLEYLKDTEQLERVKAHTPEEAPSLDTMNILGFDEGYEWPTGSVRDLLLARGGSITREEYEAFKRGVKDGQAKYWAEKQTHSIGVTGER